MPELMRRHLAAVAALVLPAAAAAQDAATGTTTIERPGPEPRGFVLEQNGRVIGRADGPGAAADIAGANVVIEEDGPRTTRLVVRNDVLFDFDRAELRAEATEALQRVAEIIRQRRPRAVRIVGHTDALGSDGYNMTLSERRARSVEQWLAQNGGDLPPMRAEGRGETEPVAPNTQPAGGDNPEGRQRNRRVEVLLDR